MTVAPAGDQVVPVRYLQALGSLHYEHFDSRILGRAFHIYTRLPDHYAESSERLPVVILLDGGSLFPSIAGQYHYLFMGGEAPPLILVALSYGSIYYREGNLRQTDYTAPAADVEFWGGAAAFENFLRDELLPWVESRWRADPGRRILFGHSLGGQFVLYSAFSQPGLFWGRIASNPALHRNLDHFLQPWDAGASDPAAPATRLFVAYGDNDLPELRSATLQWLEHWQGRDAPFLLEARQLPGQSHYSSAPEAFTQGLHWLLQPSAAATE